MDQKHYLQMTLLPTNDRNIRAVDLKSFLRDVRHIARDYDLNVESLCVECQELHICSRDAITFERMWDSARSSVESRGIDTA